MTWRAEPDWEARRYAAGPAHSAYAEAEPAQSAGNRRYLAPDAAAAFHRYPNSPPEGPPGHPPASRHPATRRKVLDTPYRPSASGHRRVATRARATDEFLQRKTRVN